MAITMKRGDTANPLKLRLSAPGGANLVDATVVLNMKNASGVVVINRKPVVIENALTCDVRYDFEVEDVAVAGPHQIEVEVTFGNGKVSTFPSKGFIHLEIEKDIA